MFRCCLFCDREFAPNHTFGAIPRGRRLAFDPARERLWVICDACFRWTLQPLEGRRVALHELERACHDRRHPDARTAHVELFLLERALVLRVGAAGLLERSWWRHGRELQRRRDAFDSFPSRVSAATFAVLRRAGEWVGAVEPDTAIHWDDDPMADVVRWRRFGWAAWRGRIRCPFCNSTLRALTYDLSWWVYPLTGEDGSVEVGVPCPRCDPWTPENIYRIGGADGERVMRKVLAWQNVAGAPTTTLEHATRAVAESGSPAAFAHDLTARRASLWKIGRVGTVALEIALSESRDQRLLELDARALEFQWRREEELAAILDGELSDRALRSGAS